MTTKRSSLALVMLAACGSDPARSGVPRDTVIVDLTPPEVNQFCEWMIDQEGGFGRDHHCEDGSTKTTTSVGVCVDTLADLTCTDTIAAFEDCILAVHGDLCQIPTDPACTAFAACFP